MGSYLWSWQRGASQRQAQKSDSGHIDPVHHRLYTVLLEIHPALKIEQGVAMKASRDDLLLRGLGEQVARQLLDDELIKGEIPVQGFDHPIAIHPDLAGRVIVVAVGVCVTSDIEPVTSPALPVGWGIQEPVHHSFVSAGIGVRDKVLHIGGEWRQAGKVKMHAPGEGGPLSLGRGLKAFLLQTGQNKPIDRVIPPLLVGNGWVRRTDDGPKRPVPGVRIRLLQGFRVGPRSAQFDPTLNRGNLRARGACRPLASSGPKRGAGPTGSGSRTACRLTRPGPGSRLPAGPGARKRKGRSSGARRYGIAHSECAESAVPRTRRSESPRLSMADRSRRVPGLPRVKRRLSPGGRNACRRGIAMRRER